LAARNDPSDVLGRCSKRKSKGGLKRKEECQKKGKTSITSQGGRRGNGHHFGSRCSHKPFLSTTRECTSKGDSEVVWGWLSDGNTCGKKKREAQQRGTKRREDPDGKQNTRGQRKEKKCTHKKLFEAITKKHPRGKETGEKTPGRGKRNRPTPVKWARRKGTDEKGREAILSESGEWGKAKSLWERNKKEKGGVPSP